VKIKWLGCCALLSRWVRFKSWWNFNSVKLGWRTVGMRLIGRSRFFGDDRRTIRRSGSPLLWFRKNDIVWFVIASQGFAGGVLGLTSRLCCLQTTRHNNLSPVNPFVLIDPLFGQSLRANQSLVNRLLSSSIDSCRSLVAKCFGALRTLASLVPWNRLTTLLHDLFYLSRMVGVRSKFQQHFNPILQWG
jgi:hypothetical protein